MTNKLIHVFDTYYLFQNKEKENVKVFTRDDIPAEEIKTRYCLASEYIFKGIFENKTNKFLSKDPMSKYIEIDFDEPINKTPKIEPEIKSAIILDNDNSKENIIL